MATKTKQPLSGNHTAGIFSDMSVDGPVIGTLVLIVDRAKNLPNRKTIGKQDPYCAARLGKEAKKTTTDIRGGQTPRWDQELRFTVHDSPDYYQLKLSVFNDDKRTDLIGETWIDLRDMIVPGGGQNDLWHQLNCKGKYAGDIRIEITYYDSRPKPEKPVVKAKQPSGSSVVEADGSVSGSVAAGPRAMPKRRPLPSDPVTGKAPAAPAAVPPAPALEPAPAQTSTPGPRPQPTQPTAFVPTQSPLQQVEYNPPAPTRHQQPDSFSSAPPSLPGTPSHRVDTHQYRTPERPEAYAHPTEERGHSVSPGYPNHNSPVDFHDERPRHGARPRQQHYHNYTEARAPQEFDDRLPMDYQYQDQRSPRDGYDSHGTPQLVDERGVSPQDDVPPPPPAHRSRNNSTIVAAQVYQNGYDVVPLKGTPPTMRHNVLRNEAHRHSDSSNYPGRPTYKGFDSAPAAPQGALYGDGPSHQPSPPRHHSYDAGYDLVHRSMQPTVEDVPESPDALQHPFRRSGSRQPQFEPNYDLSASPAPLNVSTRGPGSSMSGHYDSPSAPSLHMRHETKGYPVSQPTPPRDLGGHPQVSFPPVNGRGPKALMYHNEFDDESARYEPPPVPSSLVPGMDPAIVQEVSERFHDDRHQRRRYTQPPPMETPPRGRTMIDYPSHYEPDVLPVAYGGAPAPSHSRSPITYSGGPSTPNNIVKPRSASPNPIRDPSPNPHHIIKRKSISPAPPPPPSNGVRRLSDIPFGPDSYDELNPVVAAVATQDPVAARPDYNEVNGKIITHDGREVDPSDHLPMESWAPEPEPKQPKASSANNTPSSSARPSPAGPVPPPSSGRRPLRVALRPQSMAALPPAPSQYDHSSQDTSPTPPSAGRNRLQKRGAPAHHRASVNITITTPTRDRDLGAGNGSPLAPLPPHQDNNFTPPRGPPLRASTFDSAYGENYGPAAGLYGSSPGSGGFGGDPRMARGPPLPAKVPLALPAPGPSESFSGEPMMSGALDGGAYGARGGGDPWGGSGGGELSLMEEMQRIDIGSGRSRRHGAGY